MQPLRRRILVSALVLLGGLTLAGCSGPDDLRVENNYPFPIVLHFPHGLSETIPAQSTVTLPGKGAFGGDNVANIRFVTEQGKVLGTISTPESGGGTHEALRGEPSRFNGSATWSVTVGPPRKPETSGGWFPW